MGSSFRQRLAAVAAILALPASVLAMEPDAVVAGKRLDEGWRAFSSGLQEAQRSLLDPQYFPPPPTERNLAEGYRYLLGHLERMIQLEMRQDPRFPEFHRSARTRTPCISRRASTALATTR